MLQLLIEKFLLDIERKVVQTLPSREKLEVKHENTTTSRMHVYSDFL